MSIVRDPLDPKISMWHFLAFFMRFWREKMGLSLARCGEIIGAARSTVSNLEAARRRPQDDQMRLLDKHYGTGVLSYCIGGREVMRAQLEHLRRVMDRPNVIVRIIQPSAGAHRGFDGPFQVISLDGRDVAYAGAQNGGRLIEVPGEVRDFWTKFEHIGAKALPKDASCAIVEQYLEQYR